MARTPSSRGLAQAAAIAIAMSILVGGGCELGVGNEVPPFRCVSEAGACPSGEVCAPALGRCVSFAGTCMATRCLAGTVCDDRNTLACVASDAGATADSSSGDADSAARDGGILADATTDGPGGAVDGSTGVDGSQDVASDAAAAGLDGSPADGGVDAPVTGTDGGGSCRTDGGSGLACRCSGATDCASGVCGGAAAVTAEVFAAAGNANFCTQPCCTSADCDSTTVCFGTGLGGSYCVPPTWLSRSPMFGALAGGAQCSSDTECRSGLCAAGGCADTCCSTSQASHECGGGTGCNLGNFPGISFDTHPVAFCGASAACAFGSPCTACRQKTDCGGLTPTCAYVAATVGSSSDIVAACTAGPTGAGLAGSTCSSNADCASAFCDSVAKQCTNVCFSDNDCTSGLCRIGVVSVQNGGPQYSLLRCGS